MGLLRTKVWSWLDIGLLKWSCLLLGAAVGAWLGEVLRPYGWLLLALGVLLAVKPAVAYSRG